MIHLWNAYSYNINIDCYINHKTIINHKTTEFFEEWNLFSYSAVFKFIKSECKLKKF